MGYEHLEVRTEGLVDWVTMNRPDQLNALNRKLIDDPAFSGWLVGRTPSRRWGEVEELAGAAVFLASEAGRFVNGHILYVDGGLTASV